MNAFFPYFGAKLRAAKHYPPPEYPLIIEPFAGSAGYSRYYWEKQIELYDISPYIATLWGYLIRAPEEDILRIPLLEGEMLVSDIEATEAEKLLVGYWCGRGKARPAKKPSSWKQQFPHKFWSEHIRCRIARQVWQCDHWKFERRDFRDIPPREATWFVDPPYEKQGKFYQTPAIDFAELADWCMSLPGQVIVCEQEGANWLPFKPAYRMNSIKNKKTTEVVWTNTPKIDLVSIMEDEEQGVGK